MADNEDQPIPALFATIHHRSDARPDGYTAEEVSWLNVQANRRIPDLYEKLLTEHQKKFGNHDR